MESERALAVEELTRAHHDTKHALKAAKEALAASKARNESQAQECARNRDHIRTLLDKTDGDNDLVDALRSEVAALNDKLKDVHAAHAAEKREDQDKTRTRRPDPEVQRLQRENARLQEQVDRQHKVIRKFRAADDDRRTANHAYAAPSPDGRPL